MKLALIFVLLMVAITGCGGGIGGTGGTIEAPTPEVTASQSILVSAGTTQDFSAYITSSFERWGGLTEQSAGLETALASPFTETAGEFPAPDSDSGFALVESLDTGGRVTATNTIVSHVDESDVAKYDGEILYLANRQHLSVIETPSAGVPVKLADIRITEAEGFDQIQGLYLDGDSDRLVTINSYGGGYGRPFLPAATELAILPVGSSNISLNFVDVSNPATPGIESSMSIEGNLITSRRVGSTLYLVSLYTPFIEGFQPYASDEKSQADNEQLLEETDPADLIPKVTLDGIERDLVDPEACLIPNPDLDIRGEGQPTLTIVTAVDINSRTIESLCLADQGFGVHMTESSLYIASPGHSEAGVNRYVTETTFHKISLGSSPSYIMSGSVSGSFWGDPAFLMAEHEDRFTVITTTEEDGETQFLHRLSILEENPATERLEISGAIPNDNRPEAIGKPGEQIFASRIIGNRAYVVTFQQIDPVYAIDLADPTDPRILGELEIPGFSSYLHPVSEDLLIGIGTDTRTEDGRVINNGVNVRLFNVADPTNIELVDETILGQSGSFSEVSFDYKAFTYQALNGDQARFAIPVTRHGAHGESQSSAFFSPWTDTSLFLFDVETGNSPRLSQTGMVTAEDFSTGRRYPAGCCTWGPRSFINGDSIFYLNKSRLFTSTWASPETTEEFFIDTQFVNPENMFCAEFLPEPLSVSSVDLVTGEYLNCHNATIEPLAETDELIVEEACESATVSTSPAIEGPGSYVVTVALDGYLTRTVEDVRITENECFLGTTHLTMYLEPEQ